MEFKKAIGSLEGGVSKALEQIEEKKYEGYLKEYGVSRILKIGISLQGQENAPGLPVDGYCSD